MIEYRRIDYNTHKDKAEIKRMYQQIFDFDAEEQYDFWNKNNPNGNSVGIIAIDDSCGKAVGHFTTIRQKALIKGDVQYFRISMGFMTDADYRGRGIATNLYRMLKKELQKEQESNCFIIGFPNENSFHMHINKMEYEEYKTMRFVVLPKSGNEENSKFNSINHANVTAFEKNNTLFNCVYFDDAFLHYRFKDNKYEKYISSSGNLYISTQFHDKIDILYWSDLQNEKELLEFAQFLYKKDGINKVTTWDSLNYLDKYPKEDRSYHMCINYLDCNEKKRNDINNPWVFLMGGCELF